MRILTLSNCPLDESSGSGYVVLGYVRGLRALGHQVDVRGPADYEILRHLKRGIRYRQAVGMAVEGLRGAGAGYDLLEFYGAEAWLALALLAKLPRRKFLLVIHSNGLETHSFELLERAEVQRGATRRRPWYQRDHSALAARAFRSADGLVTVGGFDRDYALRQRYVPPARILAIDNPLPEAFLGLEVRYERPLMIGYCGSWIPRKGVDLIVRDLPPLLREFPAWRLVLVGVGDGFDPARHFPLDVLPQVEVIPSADRCGARRALYQELAIAILPSAYESFGLVAAEAMACGCALVASPVGFAAALRDSKEALLLEGNASPALYRALRRLILDEDLRRSIAEAGRRRVQSLRWTTAVARLDATYRQWLGELPGRNGAPS